MAEPPLQVVVLVCCYNGRRHLPELLGSLARAEAPGLELRIVVVDNASTDGSGEYVRRHFPQVDCLRLEINRGFTGGNNFGYAHIRAHYPDARHLVLLNTDTIVERDWLRPLVEAMAADPALGGGQPTLLLHPQTDRINTLGNRSHFLGFGMMRAYGKPRTRAMQGAGAMDFPSGAAVMLRMDVLTETGLFDEALHMYLEDADLGWKLRQRGWEIRHVPQSIVYHKYVPDAPARHYRDLERNRWLLLLTYYKWPTLIVLTPALAVMELGQLVHAAGQGVLGAKLGSWAELLSPRMRAVLRARRRTAQDHRRLNDRRFMGGFAGRVHLPTGDPWLLRWVGNPLLAGYWRAVRWLIRW